MCITVLNQVFSGTVTTMARRCCRFFSRGTTLVLLMSGLLSAVHLFLYSAISLSLPHNLKLALEYIETLFHCTFWFLCWIFLFIPCIA